MRQVAVTVRQVVVTVKQVAVIVRQMTVTVRQVAVTVRQMTVTVRQVVVTVRQVVLAARQVLMTARQVSLFGCRSRLKMSLHQTPPPCCRHQILLQRSMKSQRNCRTDTQKRHVFVYVCKTHFINLSKFCLIMKYAKNRLIVPPIGNLK